MDSSNHYELVRQRQAEVEKKVKNTPSVPFKQNIQHAECEYTPTEDSMSNTADPGLDALLYSPRLKKLCVVMVVAIVLSLLAIGLAIFAVIKYTDAAKELQLARENQGKVCLPCEDSAIQLNSWKVRNAAGDCCVRLEEVLEMTGKIAKERASQEVQEAQEKMIAKFSGLEGEGRGTPVLQEILSAHIVLDHNDERRFTWTTSESLFAHISADIILTNNRTGKVRVTKAGYYFVYSQLSLTLDQSYYSQVPIIRHQMLVQKPGDKERIFVESADMLWKAIAQRTYSAQTSHTSGVVYLPSQSTVRMELLGSSYLRSCEVEPCYIGSLGMYRL